ncbi:chorismate mutase [Candidatus Coxiella mudrowiae]
MLNQRAEYALEIVKVKIAEDWKLTKFYRPKRKAEILEKNHYSE